MTSRNEMKRIIEEQRNRITGLLERSSNLNFCLLSKMEEIVALREENENLKNEKAALIQENIELLEKLRSVLKSEVGAV